MMSVLMLGALPELEYDPHDVSIAYKTEKVLRCLITRDIRYRKSLSGFCLRRDISASLLRLQKSVKTEYLKKFFG